MTQIFKTPVTGFRSEPLPVPALDFANAIQQTVAAPGANIALQPGIYNIVGSADFAFAHAPAADIAGITARAPWFANVYLTLYIDAPQTLRIDVASGSAELTIIPAKVH